MGLFENAIACFIGYYEAAYETGLKKTNKQKKWSPKTELVYGKQREIALIRSLRSGWVGSLFACWKKIEITDKVKIKVLIHRALKN